MQRIPFSTDDRSLNKVAPIEHVKTQLHMKGLFQSLYLALLAIALLIASGNARAQTNFALSVTTSPPGSLFVSNSVTYTISVTNLINGPATGVTVTNTWSQAIALNAVTPSPGGTVETNATSLVFFLPNFSFVGDFRQMSVTVTPSTTGSLTNQVIVAILGFTNLVITNVVNDVTNLVAAPTDLAVSVTGPGPDIYINDWITYKVSVTNSGASAASSVVLTNRFQPSVKSITPANFFPNGTAVVNLGTLAAQAATNIIFTVQPTNGATNLSFTASIGSAATDSNSSNNVVTITNAVLNFLTNTMVAVTNEPIQTFNPESGLMEQRIVLSNTSPATVDSARVIVAGLGTTNRLFNAAGTNDGRGFVVHVAPLGPSESVSLLLQFKVPTHQPFQIRTSNLIARATLAADLTPPAFAVPSAVVNYTRITNVNNTMFIEFPSTNGRSYTVVYSDDSIFSNPKVVRPSIVAPANWTYFIDYGPPATPSAPMNSSARYYKVYLNP